MSDFFISDRNAQQSIITTEFNPEPPEAQRGGYLSGAVAAVSPAAGAFYAVTDALDINWGEIGRASGRSLAQFAGGVADLGTNILNIPNNALETPDYLIRGNDAQRAATRRLTDPNFNARTDASQAAAQLRDYMRSTQAPGAIFARDPAPQSEATQLLSGLAEVMTPALLAGPLGAGGPATALAFSTEERTYLDMIDRGVREEVARGAALQDAAFMSAMGVAPIAFGGTGRTFATRLLQRGATGAVINLAFGAAMRGNMNVYLTEQGYPEIAREYQYIDTRAMLIDGIMGAVFGGVFGRSLPPSAEPHVTPMTGRIVLDAAEEAPQQLPQDADGYFEEARQYGTDQQLPEAYAYALIARDLGHPEADGLLALIEEEASATDMEQGRAIATDIIESNLSEGLRENGYGSAALIEAGRINDETAFGIPENPGSRRWQSEALDRMESQVARDEPIDPGPVPEDVGFVDLHDVEMMAAEIEYAARAIDGAPQGITDWVRRQGEVRDDRGRVIQRGGIRDDRGDVAGSAGDGRRGFASLLSNTGRSIDDLALSAWEQGYFPGHAERPTVREFIDALDQDSRDPGSVNNDADAAWQARNARDIIRHYEQRGIDVSLRGEALRDEVRRISAEGLWEDAMRAFEEEALAARLDETAAEIARLREERGDVLGPREDGALFSVGRRGGERRSDGFYDERLSPQQNKAVEMARNNYSNAEIADEMDISSAQVGVLLSQAKSRVSGLEIPPSRRGAPSGQKNGNPTATIEEIVSLYNRLARHGYRNAPGRAVLGRRNLNTVVAERLGVSVNSVTKRLSTYRADLEAGRTQGEPLYSYGDGEGFSTVAELEARAAEELGADLGALMRSGKAELVETASALPFAVPAEAQAVHYKGKSYFIADRISLEEIVPKILHEVGYHEGMEGLVGAKGVAEINRQIARMYAENHPLVREAVDFALQASAIDNLNLEAGAYVAERAQRAREGSLRKLSPEEQRGALAYLIELRPDMPLVQRILSRIRQWLIKTFGSTFGMRLTVDDLRALALTSLRRVAEQARRDGAPEGVTEVLAAPRYSAADGPDAGQSGAGQQAYVQQLRDQGFDVDGEWYHGTQLEDGTEITQFDVSRAGQGKGTAEERAIWLADSGPNARPYAKTSLYRNAAIYPVYVRGRMMRFDAEGRTYDWSGWVTETLERARSEGYDGVVFENMREPLSGGGDQLAVFDPANIAFKYGRANAPDGGMPLARSWRTEPAWREQNGVVELFHASPSEISEFRPNTFFSTTADYAEEMFGNVPGQRVYRAEAQIRRPYDVTDAEREAFERADSALLERARSQGYDAVRMEDDLGGYEVIPLNAVRLAPDAPNAGSGGDFPMFSFGGRRARTADKGALAEAQRRLARGDDAESVRQETGWFQGEFDGQWRFELDDSQARWVKPPKGAGRLADFLQHEALFRAYPELRSLRVEFDRELGGGSSGQAENRNNSRRVLRIRLAPNESREQLLLSLTHEIQHGIQTIEGFANGEARWGQSNKMYWDQAHEREARDVEMRMAMTPEQRQQTPPSPTRLVENILQEHESRKVYTSARDAVIAYLGAREFPLFSRGARGQNAENLVGAKRDPIESQDYQQRLRALRESDGGQGRTGEAEGSRTGSVRGVAGEPAVRGDGKLSAAALQEVLAVSGIHISTKQAGAGASDFGAYTAVIDTPFASEADAVLQAARGADGGPTLIDFDLIDGSNPKDTRLPGVHIRLSRLNDGAKGVKAGVWFYRHMIEWADRQGLPVYSDSLSVSKEAQNVYDALARRGYDVERLGRPKRSSDGSLLSTDGTPVYRVSRRGEIDEPLTGAPLPRNDYEVDGPTLRERQQVIDEQRAREDAYNKLSPVEQVLVDEPDMPLMTDIAPPMLFSRGPKRRYTARQAMEDARLEAERAAEMRKGFEAAARCAARHGAAQASRASVITAGVIAQSTPASMLGQTLGLVASIPVGVTIAPLLGRSANERRFVEMSLSETARNIAELEARQARNANQAGINAGLDAPTTYNDLQGEPLWDNVDTSRRAGDEIPPPNTAVPIQSVNTGAGGNHQRERAGVTEGRDPSAWDDQTPTTFAAPGGTVIGPDLKVPPAPPDGPKPQPSRDAAILAELLGMTEDEE